MSSMYGGDYTSYFDQFGSYYSAMDVWQEMLPGEDGEPISDLVKTQYDMLYGHWPENYDEVVLFVDKNNEISDLVMYAMGPVSYTHLAGIFEGGSLLCLLKLRSMVLAVLAVWLSVRCSALRATKSSPSTT